MLILFFCMLFFGEIVVVVKKELFFLSFVNRGKEKIKMIIYVQGKLECFGLKFVFFINYIKQVII